MSSFSDDNNDATIGMIDQLSSNSEPLIVDARTPTRRTAGDVNSLSSVKELIKKFFKCSLPSSSKISLGSLLLERRA